MVYNLTNVTNANTIVDIVSEVNKLSGAEGLFIGMVLLILFVTFLVVFKKKDFRTVFVADCFFISILAAMSFIFGWIGSEILIVPIIMLFASIIIYYFVT